MTKCITCKQETFNPKFCSQSCAAKFNNKIAPRRQLEGKCSKCLKPIKSSRKYCKECFQQYKRRDYGSMPLSDFREQCGSRNSYMTQVRQHARSIAKNAGLLKSCKVCNYSRCVQACHIKPVASFTEDTLLRIVNLPSNLVGLCPTHHWELDHGFYQMI